jgi:hypothetical protein
MSKVGASSMPTKFDVEKFNGKGNFGLWQKRVKALLVQQGLHKALQGKKSKAATMTDEDWEEIDLKAASTIQLCLADEVMYNVMDEETATGLWLKLESLYMTKSLSNKLYLKKKLYGLRMQEGTAVLEHMNFFNRIISELLAVGVIIDEEDKALILLSSLPESYDHIVTTMLYGKDTLDFEEVTGTLLSNEIRKRPNQVGDQGELHVGVGRGGGKTSQGSSRVCYFCHKEGHFKRDCKARQEWMKKKETRGEAGVAINFENDVLLTVVDEHNTSHGKGWVLDSGSAVHVCSHHGMFTSFVAEEGTVRMVDGSTCRVMGTGTVKIKGKDGTVRALAKVRYVPEARCNLISMGVLDEEGCRIQVQQGVVTVSHGSKVILEGEKCDGVYKLTGRNSVRGGVPRASLQGSSLQGGASRVTAKGPGPGHKDASWIKGALGRGPRWHKA